MLENEKKKVEIRFKYLLCYTEAVEYLLVLFCLFFFKRAYIWIYRYICVCIYENSCTYIHKNTRLAVLLLSHAPPRQCL